jgi:hypothetical protein
MVVTLFMMPPGALRSDQELNSLIKMLVATLLTILTVVMVASIYQQKTPHGFTNIQIGIHPLSFISGILEAVDCNLLHFVKGGQNGNSTRK